MTDEQLKLHREVTRMIDMVDLYVRTVEKMKVDDPDLLQAVIQQVRMETRLKDILIHCQDVL